MIKKLKNIWRKYFIFPLKIFRISVVDTINQDGVEHAGYLAFLLILAIFPFLIFLISIIGSLGASNMGIEFIKNVLHSMPKEIVRALLPRINEILSGPPQHFLTIAIIGVIWTASSLVEGCRTILNRAYRVYSPPPYVLRRLVSIVEFFIITFLMVVGIFVFVVVPRIFKALQQDLKILNYINFDFLYLRHILLFILLVAATSMLYYALPNIKQKIVRTIPGAILTVVLWIFFEKIFLLYLKTFHQFNFVYGSLTGIIVILLFFYLVSLVFILGAEFNYHFYKTYKRIKNFKL